MDEWEGATEVGGETNTGSNANYILKHWRGEFSLPHSYWINLILLVAGLTILLAIIIQSLSEISDSLRTVSLLSLAYWPLAVLLWIWGVIGVWRSADNRVLQHGPSGWATLAKILVGIGALTMANQIVNSAIPQMIEHSQIAFGADRFKDGTQMTVTDDGASIGIRGLLGEGSAARFDQNLSLHPDANVVVLDSMGGRIFEAQKIASIVTSRGLNTYVEGSCASACTLILLAGVDRAATPNAQIGFHQPDFPGLDEESRRSIISENRHLYLRAGVNADFIDRALSAKPDEMWYPTTQELMAAGVLNRLSLGGETRIGFSKVNSRQSLKKELRKTSIYRALSAKHPQLFEEFVEASWAAVSQGNSDNEIMSAGRAVLSKNLDMILVNSDDETLRSYLDLVIDQTKVAKKHGSETCGRYIRGTLNPLAVFPATLIKRDLALLERALMADASDPGNVSIKNGENAFLKAASRLPEHQLVLFSTLLESGNDAAKCDASLAFYTELAKLRPQEQAAAMRYLFTMS